MKKLLPVILTLCLLLAGCAKAPPLPEDPFAARVVTALRQAAPREIGADTETTMDGQSGRAVRVDADLLAGVADLLALAGETAPVDMKSIEGNQLELVMLQGEAGGETLRVELYGCGPQHYLYPGRTVAWLQLGEERGQFLMERAVFDQVLALLEEHTYVKHTELDVDYIPLQLSQGDRELRREGYGLESVMQLENMFLFCFEADDSALLEGVLAADGRSLYSLEERGGHGAEAWDGGRYDYFLHTPQGLVLRSSHDTALRGEHPLPAAAAEAMMNARGGSDYHLEPETGRLAYAGEEGIWLLEPGQTAPRLVMDNDRLPALLGDRLPPDDPLGDGAGELCRLYSPRLAEGEDCVTALIDIPGSQAGLSGAASVNLETGELSCYTEPFGLWGMLRRDDRIVTLHHKGITRLDLMTGEQHSYPGMADSVGIVLREDGLVMGRKQGFDENGQPLMQIYLSRLDQPEETPFFTARGGDCELVALTQDYAVCMLSRQGEMAYAALPLPGGPGGPAQSGQMGGLPANDVLQ